MKVKLVSIACIPEEQDWIKLDDLIKIMKRVLLTFNKSYIVAEVVKKLVFENSHRAFISWTPNYTDLQKIETSLECKFYLPPNVGCDTTEKIALVKKKIYDGIVVNKAETVYNPDSFREFFISAGATKLYDTVQG